MPKLGYDLFVSALGAPEERPPNAQFFVWGENDPFGDLGIARQVCEILPDARLHTLQGSGHLPWLDAPEEVAAVFKAFIEAHA